ncbi:excinuclease ABC subunit C [Listeria aquatica]|uniref:Excinuclease ABC subunit C n=1 Tax=Listeria aquatica TaxID=1494960 RepID=A0A841ZMX2_9LIST|nr:excinuclease ABC subunit UvrC [Listeria aquatica]MBC1520061.1 excinuclease ABC subunit C [Listeria aquatica]
MSKVLLKQKLSILPESPGCYIYKDAAGEILYIGKSKNLKKRVKSYFTKTQTGKTARLVHYIEDLELILTDSEKEALLLEMSLIMKYQPPYNILLKDEVHYSYIKITNEKNPRLVVTREIKKDGAAYFGPYTSKYSAEKTKELLQKIYPLCHCSGKKGRPCFYYHLGMCIGPCAREVSQQEYQAQIKRIKRFFYAGHSAVRRVLEERRDLAASEWQFERAQEVQEWIEALEQVTEKQKVVIKDREDRDVIDFVHDAGALSIQIFFVRNGAIVGRSAQILEQVEEIDGVIEAYVQSFYEHPNHLLPKKLLVSEEIDARKLAEELGVKVKTPKRGEKRAVLQLVQENACSALRAHFKMLDYEYEAGNPKGELAEKK